MTHNEVPKINFIISENILAMSQIFLSHSAISVFLDVGVITETEVKTEQGCLEGRYLKANTLIFLERRSWDKNFWP